MLMHLINSNSGDNEALPMKTEPKSTYQISAEKRKAALVSAPAKSVIPCDQRGMCERNQLPLLFSFSFSSQLSD